MATSIDRPVLSPIGAEEAAGDRPRLTQEGIWSVSALSAFALVIGAYYAFRFGGRWAESDAAAMAGAIRSIIRYETLIPWEGSLYPNGYVFGVVSTFIVAFTGVDVPTLLQLVYPLVSASLVVIAWTLYRELSGSERAATLGTLILFLQPEFLFVILRGSHERVLRALILISLWLLVRSFRHAGNTRAYAIYVGLFYLSVYGVLATNSLFGSSFTWALTIALIGSWFGAYLGPRLRAVSLATRRRLVYIPVFCAMMVILFNGYLYPPAGMTFGQVTSIFDGLQRLLLTTSPQSSADAPTAYNAYEVVTEQWVDLKIYFLLSIGTYMLMLGSAVIWVRMGLRWLAGAAEPTLGSWFLWIFYAGFALQGGLSIIADITGSFGGNLQHRSFPSFVMVAAPLVAAELVRWKPNRRARALAAAGVAALALFSVVKATSDPAISNKWTFYRPEEAAAIFFLDRRIKDGVYWSDFDERLRMVQGTLVDSQILAAITPNPGIRTYLVTDLTRRRAVHLRRPLPPVSGELRVYDNGAAQVYRTRARTPYQE